MEPFELFIPTKIYFGENCLKKSLQEINTRIGKRPLIISGKISAKENGYLDAVCQSLEKNVVCYGGISSNPKCEEIDKAIELGLKEEVDLVIGLGGGSSLDAAKVVAAGVGMKKTTRDFLFDGIIPDERTLPIIAIPTTAGTGSELSRGAIISDVRRTLKLGIRSDYIIPTIAIIDPSLTFSLPRNKTMEMGFDVLAHAIESFISLKASPFSETLSLETIKVVVASLRELHIDINNSNARQRMSYFSMLMGMNLCNVGTALPHRLQYPIGAHTNTSHAAGLLTIYPAWIEEEYKYSKEKITKIIEFIHGITVESKKEAKNYFCSFLQEIELEYCIEDLGATIEDIEIYAREVTGNIKNDPAAAGIGVIKNIYKGAFKG